MTVDRDHEHEWGAGTTYAPTPMLTGNPLPLRPIQIYNCGGCACLKIDFPSAMVDEEVFVPDDLAAEWIMETQDPAPLPARGGQSALERGDRVTLPLSPQPDFDQDALTAAFDLIGRSGAASVEIGWEHDEGWYCQAVYQGARLVGEGPGPVEAAEHLARRVLKGARCRRCGEPIRISEGKGCRWRRVGERWGPGCGDTPIDTSIPIPGAQREAADD